MTGEQTATARPIDTTVAHPARRYNYWLGGKDHFQVDRDSGDAIAAVFPTIWSAARQNRAFARRAVTYLVGEVGIRQILDIGTGIPAPDNTHEVAQALAPDTRVVYVDNDPIVLAHARALLTGSRQGATGYIDADLRTPDVIWHHPTLHTVLDLSQPVGLLLVAVLQFIGDEHDPHRIVRGLLEALPAGSHLVVSHPTLDVVSTSTAAAIRATAGTGGFWPRTRGEFARFFDGLDLVEPGIGSIIDWHPEPRQPPTVTAAATAMYGAVARLP